MCPEEQSGDHLIGAGLHPQLLSADEKRVLPPGQKSAAMPNLNVKVKKMWKRKKNDEAEQMTMEPVQELDAVEEEKKRKEREQKLRENISRLYDNEKERADIEADITSVYADMKKEDLNKALLRKIFQLCSFKEGMRDLEVNFVYETYNKSIDLK